MGVDVVAVAGAAVWFFSVAGWPWGEPEPPSGRPSAGRSEGARAVAPRQTPPRGHRLAEAVVVHAMACAPPGTT